MTKKSKAGSREAMMDLRDRIRAEGAEDAFNALRRVCNDPKASAQALATAGSTIFRAAGLFEKNEDDDAGLEPHEMTVEQIERRLKHLRRGRGGGEDSGGETSFD